MERSAAALRSGPVAFDLAGKRVILRWNGKHNGDLLLDYLHSLLSRALSGHRIHQGV